MGRALPGQSAGDRADLRNGADLRAFSRVYAGWAFSQDFFREQEYRKPGLASVEDAARFAEGYFRQRDANDLLAMLWTWQHADISDNDVFHGDLGAALATIRARAIVMPSATDLYFRVRDNEIEVAQMPRAELRPIPSIWGHLAGLGANPPDNQFIDDALTEPLGTERAAAPVPSPYLFVWAMEAKHHHATMPTSMPGSTSPNLAAWRRSGGFPICARNGGARLRRSAKWRTNRRATLPYSRGPRWLAKRAAP